MIDGSSDVGRSKKHKTGSRMVTNERTYSGDPVKVCGQPLAKRSKGMMEWW